MQVLCIFKSDFHFILSQTYAIASSSNIPKLIMNILVLYDYYTPTPLRQTFKDYLESFGKHSPHKVFYCNYAYGLPNHIQKFPFDLILLHQGISCQLRWCGLPYESYLKRLMPIKDHPAPKAIFSQDEFLKMDMVNRMIDEFGIKTIFTVAEESEWKTIYYNIDRSKVQIYKVLTGYLDDEMTSTISALEKERHLRDIDIGYRATHAEPWLGKFGKRKIEIAEIIEQEARKRNLNTDISTIQNEKNFYHGLDWYRFMLRCKNFIGVEGGSSLFDKDGSLCQSIKDYMQKNPSSDYEAIEQSCFPGIDGNLALMAISPRHLEACATKTCQILLEGNYSGILKPGIHYIELKKDYSNLQEVFEKAQQPQIRKKLTDQAYKDIVESGLYSYSAFVADTLSKCLPTSALKNNKKSFSTTYHYNRFREWAHWKAMPFEFYAFRKFKQLLPSQVIEHLKTLRNRGKGI